METKEFKRCRTCGLLFTLNGFYKGRQSCKKCEALKQSFIRQRRILTSDFTKAYDKTCIYCGETKPVSEFRRDSSKTDGYGSYCKKCMREGVRKNNINNQKIVKMEDFTFYDFDKSHRGSTIGDYQFSLRITNRSYALTASAFLSTIIRRKKLTLLRIREDNITGDLHLVFNKEKGIPLSVTGQHSTNILIQSKKLVQFLVDKLKLSGDTRYLVNTTPDLSHSSDYCTLKILRKE